MRSDVLKKIYENDLYLTYLRYHPKWYLILNQYPQSYNDFEKEVKVKLKLTTADKIEQLRKQVDFISGMLNYLNSK